MFKIWMEPTILIQFPKCSVVAKSCVHQSAEEDIRKRLKKTIVHVFLLFLSSSGIAGSTAVNVKKKNLRARRIDDT